MEASRYFGKFLSGQIHVVDFPKFSPKNPKRKTADSNNNIMGEKNYAKNLVGYNC